MKRGLVAALCSVAVWLAVQGTASAQDAGFGRSGGLGLGAAVTNRGVAGASVFFVPAPRIGIQGVVHFDSVSSDDASASNFGLTLNGMYSLISDGGFELPAMVGFDFTLHSEEVNDDSESTNGLEFLLGVQPAWWPSPDVSFHLSLALLFDLGAGGGEDNVGDDTNIELPGTPEFLGSLAVTFWIK